MSSRRRLGGAAALATAAIAVILPAAGGTAEPSLGVLRAKLSDATADEQRAWTLLAKKPPRRQTAELLLRRSAERLGELRREVMHSGLAAPVAGDVNFFLAAAQNGDDLAAAAADFLDPSRAFPWIEKALKEKASAFGALQTPVESGSQCADGRDNDGDRLVDARHDSGCTNGKDATERSPLTCTLRDTGDPVTILRGSCSGPFSKVEITAPFDVKSTPSVKHAVGCRYASARRLECLMRDGTANPKHVLDVRLRLREGSLSAIKVRIIDLGGRASIVTSTPPAERPFSLGPSAVSAFGTFTNGRGGCPFATSFTDSFQFLALGDGTLTITQPKTGDRVSGPIAPDGSFRLRSVGESYDGRIAGNAVTATYTYTRNGCTETYDVTFVLQR